MPCYTDPHAYCNHDSSEREQTLCDVLSRIKSLDALNKRILENLQEKLNYYKQTSDEATAILCGLLDEIKKSNPNIVFGGQVQDWYLRHKEWDKKRNERI